MKLVILLSILVASKALRSIEEHYWRDFNGLVPNDALVGGHNDLGEETYIAQFTVTPNCQSGAPKIDTIVATLITGEDSAVAPYHGQSVYSNETNNVKVLCIDNKNRYSWILNKSTYSTNCRHVVGGMEAGVPLHIGKATYGKHEVIGKIFFETTHHSDKLIVPYDGKEITFEEFSILTHCI